MKKNANKIEYSKNVDWELDKALLLVAKRTGASIQALFVSQDLLELCKRAYVQFIMLHHLIDNDKDKIFNSRIINALRKTIDKI